MRNDVQDLVKSRKLGCKYKFPERQVQVQVAKRMVARGDEVPQVGDRVYYLIGTGDGKNISTRADAPNAVTDIDYDYYVNAQIIKPMKRILDMLCKNWKYELL